MKIFKFQGDTEWINHFLKVPQESYLCKTPVEFCAENVQLSLYNSAEEHSLDEKGENVFFLKSSKTKSL